MFRSNSGVPISISVIDGIDVFSKQQYEVVTMVLRCVHDLVDGLPELATSSARAQLPVAPHTYTGTY